MASFLKVARLLLAVLFLYPGVAMAQNYESKPGEPAKPFVWPEGKRCAVSLTFDDARLSQIDAGIALFDRYGVKVTFYISPENLEKRLDGWKAAVAAGYEIGNHTVTHPCTGNYAFARKNALEEFTLDRMAQELDRANQFIMEKLNVAAVSFAYPCGQSFVGRGENRQSYVPLVAKRFTTGRGWLNEDSNDPAFCDLPFLLGMESDGKSFDDLKKLVDKAAKEGRWLVLAGHEIGQEGNQTTLIPALEKLCQYAKDPANGVWIDTVGAVAEYIIKVR